MAKIDVILPAGGRVDDEFAARVGTHYKAIVQVGGRSVLGRIIEAVRSLPEIGRIVVIGPKAVQEHPEAVGANIFLDEGETGPENIFRGLAALIGGAPAGEERSANDAPGRVLIVTTDLPFLTGDNLRRYIDLCPKDKDFTVPLIGKNAWSEAYPGADATFVKLKDGEWTTGCAYLATPAGLYRAKPHIERVFAVRKSKMGIAKLLGPVFVAKWLLNRLTVADVERKVRQLLDCSAVAVPNSPPELAFDIDYLDDYEHAQKLAGAG